MFFPEIAREGLGRFQTAFCPFAPLVDQAANQLFHGHTNLAGFASEPGLVSGIDVVACNACAHYGGPVRVDSLFMDQLDSTTCYHGLRVNALNLLTTGETGWSRQVACGLK